MEIAAINTGSLYPIITVHQTFKILTTVTWKVNLHYLYDMSAKLFKSLANGECRIRSATSGTVRIYWVDRNEGLKHMDISPFHGGSVYSEPIDLTKYASIESLRKSESLRKAITKGWLKVV